MAPDPGRRGRRHHLRLAHHRRKTTTETLLPNPQTNLRRQPPLGHGPRRREPENRTGEATRRAARRTAEGDVSVDVANHETRCSLRDVQSRKEMLMPIS